MQYPQRNGRKYDPVEDTEVYKKVIEKIEKELDERMKDKPQGMGSCHIYWELKKELLADAGIEWKSPKECNPYIMFD
jgi:hypothetical protein